MLSALGPDELLFRLTEVVTGNEERVLRSRWR